MKNLIKAFSRLVLVCIMVVLTGCDHKPSILSSLSFKAINISAEGEKKPTAQGGNVSVTVTTSFTLVINGQSTTVTTTTKSNELPVMVGNEVEVIFTPSCPENSEAFFTLPDGKTQKVTASSPSFKWTVPYNFKSGMEIKGESNYKTEDAQYKATGKIVLVSIEDF